MTMQKALRSMRCILALLAIGLTLQVSAQRNCGTMEYLEQQIQQDPGRGARLEQIDSHTVQFELDHGHEDRAVVTVPVVFHVVYNTTAQNVSDAKLLAQLQQLNDDFARLNSDANQTPSIFTGVAANTELQFCLAQRDPSGNATNGIVRRQTTVSSFSSNDAVKFTANGGSDAWPRDSYLNIWVANLSGGLLGYAQFPGGAAATDGVVVLFSSVGSIASPGTGSPFNLGRTLTHEVGHWANLRHIWGDATCGSDQVSDTPVHNTSNGGCPTYPHLSTCSGTPVEMSMNYMDYSNDVCMNIFTLGQKTRMQALFGTGGSRVALLSSQGCVPPGGGSTCSVPVGLGAGNVTTSSATASWGAVSGAASYDLDYKATSATAWTTVNTTTTSASLTGLTAGTSYDLRVRANCSGSSSAYSTVVSFTTQQEGGCPDALEPNNSSTAAATVTLPLNLNALIASSSDADYYAFATTGTNNLSLSLGNLAGDYDLRLLNSAGAQLAISENTGTTAESITYNNAPAGTYYIHVFGYNGAFSTTQCYALSASATAVASCGTPTNTAASSITASSVVISWTAVSGATSYTVQWKTAAATTWSQGTVTGTSTSITGLTASTSYNARVQAVCGTATSAFGTTITFSTSASANCTSINAFESNNTTSAAKTISVNTNIQAGITSTTDLDWFKFNNTNSARNIRIDLTNLPADYDVRLYRGTSTQVGISENDGTANETIVFNTTTRTTYYVRVNGFNGAFSTSQCYTLRANISGSAFRLDGSGEGDGESEELLLEPAVGLMNLYPNPSNDLVNLEYVSTADGALTMVVMDGMGRLVHMDNRAVAGGTNVLALPVDRMLPGIYFLQLTNGDQRETVRFVVER
jgi:hypothetical protein